VTPDLEQTIESQVEALGFEVVDLEIAGNRRRPLIRLRIDRPDSTPGHGVTVDDCARVSRALEPLLDTRAELPAHYVLEVSSPGMNRPIVKRRHFERYVGREVAVHGAAPLAGRQRRLEGILLGIEGEGPEERLRLRLRDGTDVELPRTEIVRANLIERWEI
jgi:ribosome maturation factor RimP